MMKTIETADYVGQHKDKVVKFTNKVNALIKLKLGDNELINNFIKESNKRALTHDDDKLKNYKTLELYSSRDEFETEEQKKEYKQLHKLSQNHHVDFFINKGIQMSINDIYEMMADVYSSTLLRGKKSYEEILEEQDTGKFSNDYLYMILNTYGLVNYNFKTDKIRKYPNAKNTYDFIDLVRETILQGKKMKPFLKLERK